MGQELVTETAGPKRPGGRSARIRRGVLLAAIDELADRGYAGFAIAEVARRANVHPTSIYRKWGSRDALISDACMQFSRDRIATPDTGNLENDLVEVLVSIARLVETRPGQALIALAFSAVGLPDYRDISQSFWQLRSDAGRPLFERAVARGEWRPKYDLDDIMARLVGPLLVRSFLLQKSIDVRLIRRLVRDTLRTKLPVPPAPQRPEPGKR